MDLLLLSYTGLLILFLWYFSALPKNYLLARRTGFPISISPVTPSNPLWLIFAATYQPLMAKYLPTAIYNRIRMTIFGWQFRERWGVNAELGTTYVLTSPGGNELWTADPELMNQVLSRRNDFVQLEMASRIMSFFGPNITSSNGDQWLRYRKTIAPLLSERIMHAVWVETVNQIQQMLREILSHESTREPESNEVIEGIRTIAINVIGSITYGNQHPWIDSHRQAKLSLKSELTFIESLMWVVNHHVIAVFLPDKIMRHSMMPRWLRRLGAAVVAFSDHAHQLIQAHRMNSDGRPTIVGSLVRLVDISSSQAVSGKDTSAWTEDEVVGNLFNLTIAGFDTTASTIAYALLALTIEPQWQQWISEEIDSAAYSNKETDYPVMFISLTRCLALMYEVLRLYTPVLHITRSTPSDQQLSGQMIPAGTNVFLATGCVHVSPEHYGPDPLAFRPSRWLQKNISPAAGKERLITPSKGIFLPWSGGPRYCPGTKMAQVEFVAVMSKIFSSWRIEPVKRRGETREQAIHRLQMHVAVQLRRPEEISLRFIRRVNT